MDHDESGCIRCEEMRGLLKGVEENMASVAELLAQVRRQMHDELVQLEDE